MFPNLSSICHRALALIAKRTHILTILAALSLAAIPLPVLASTSATTLSITVGSASVASVSPQTVITLTATVVAGSSPVNPGQVTFCDATTPFCTDVHALGTAQLTVNGTATLRFVPSLGSHSYKAIFLGTHDVTGSTSATQTVRVTVPATASSTTITSTGGPGDYTLIATVTGSGTTPPTGTVSFLDTDNANYVLGTANLTVGASGLGLINKSTTPTHADGQAITTGDFNGDGIPDVAEVSSDGTLAVLLGNGDGTFTAAPSIPAGSFVLTITTADFNGDGKADLAVGSFANGSVNVLLGNGDGTFVRGPNLVDDDGLVAMLVPADLNGDGIEDIVGVDALKNRLFILLGHGDGTFSEVSTHPATGQNPVAVAIGDYNGDGKLDLAVDNVFDSNRLLNPVSLTILLGNGDGTFTPAAPVPVGIGPESIVTADFNGDGKLDLAVANIQPPATVEVFLGNGDGTFAGAVSTLPINYLNTLAIGDFNGDKIPDIATFEEVGTTAPQNVIALIGNGDGTFTNVSGSDLAVPNMGAVADFNRDGLDDIAVANETTGVTVMLSQLSGSATATVTGISPVGTGLHYVDANYPGDGSNLPSLSLTIPLTAQRVPTTLSLSANPSTNISAGESVALSSGLAPHNAQNHEATGSVAFSNNTASLGSSALSAGTATLNTSTLTAGSDALLAEYPGDTNFEPSSATLSVTTGNSTPAISLTSSLNPAPALTPITFTAQLPAGSGGTVVFAINGQNITTTPNAAGTATTTISTLTQGSYLITATWFAPGHALSAQASLTQVVTPTLAAPDFSLTGTNITFKVLHSGTGDLELASLNNFAGNIAITCNPPYPANYTCTLQYSSVSLTAGSSSVFTFTLNYSPTASVRTENKIFLAALFPLTLLSLIGLARKRSTPLRALLSLVLLAILATATTACGPDHFIPITTGTFPITFTATGTSQGTNTPITHTVTINATIVP